MRLRHAFPRGLLVLVLALASCAAPFAAGAPSASGPITYRVSKTYSNVGFTIYKWVVLKEEGLFRDFAGQVVYDASEPARSRVQFTVQVASIDTRNDTRDGVLRSEDFFAAEKYPTMSFTSNKVAARPDGSLEVTGDLRIRDVTKSATMPVRYLGANSVPNVGQLAGFETTFTIDRTDFGVNGWKWSGGKLTLSKEVSIHIIIGAVKAE